MILSDKDIYKLIGYGKLIINPFDIKCVGSNGIDLRLGDEYATINKPTILKIDNDKLIDGNLEEHYEIRKGEWVALYPQRSTLITTVEYIRMPDNVMGFLELRSTYARLGLMIPPTFVDAGFEGNLVIEIFNPTLSTFKIRRGTRIVTLVLARLSSRPILTYAKKGRYQKQKGLTLPKLKIIGDERRAKGRQAVKVAD